MEIFLILFIVYRGTQSPQPRFTTVHVQQDIERFFQGNPNFFVSDGRVRKFSFEKCQKIVIFELFVI